LSVLGTLPGTIFVILKILKIELFTFIISFNAFCDEESVIFLQTKVYIQHAGNIGLKYGFIMIFLTISCLYSNFGFFSQQYQMMLSGANFTVIKGQRGMSFIDKVEDR
jgi:hypothetical protein